MLVSQDHRYMCGFRSSFQSICLLYVDKIHFLSMYRYIANVSWGSYAWFRTTTIIRLPFCLCLSLYITLYVLTMTDFLDAFPQAAFVPKPDCI